MTYDEKGKKEEAQCKELLGFQQQKRTDDIFLFFI